MDGFVADLASPLDDDVATVSSSCPRSFHLGTGASLFSNVLGPALESATSEIIFVTCFWAPSASLSALHHALARLARRRRRHLLDHGPLARLTVRISFSSRSLLQKLFHPQSSHGYVYPPSAWEKQLGLPSPQLLDAGAIDLRVKTLFFLPFSVMHPKFVIVDRTRAFVPSCNVSWEPWLEGCLELTGDAVARLLAFYARTWESNLRSRPAAAGQDLSNPEIDAESVRSAAIRSPADYRLPLPPIPQQLPTLVLPSSHHVNPRFRFPWQKAAPVPPTPLNVALLGLFRDARLSIYLQTPNLTCEPVVAALLDALSRGVDVTIVTNRNMMVLEQLITAGTTTGWCVQSLVRRFRRLQAVSAGQSYDPEAGHRNMGKLFISSFCPRRKPAFHSPENQPPQVSTSREEEPIHSHFKLCIVDGEFTMLGSGNMDRASWYTSQELGILIHGREFAQGVKAGVDRVLDGRIDVMFDSSEPRP
ncbi:phospholipase D p2 [Echria macrotheca]|uniref:Phospholipase D p2 n=1 Tax=Echria macrotheca TaxID=438768 RepID=A0AAJ0F0W0_9PEZI|nr:phospholipase D p2 [Echria macrotheca]